MQRLPAAWIDGNASLDDPVNFCGALAAALREAGRLCGIAVPPVLFAEHAVYGGSIAYQLHALADAYRDRLPELAIVVDDYHRIGNAVIHTAVADLADRLPKRFRLVIASRTNPPLPLARVRAAGRLVEIRADALAFTPEETAGVLRDVTGAAADDRVAGEIHERAGGWPAAVRLAAMLLREQRDPGRAFDLGDHTHIAAYLSEQILATLPPELREFMLDTSVLEEMPAALCDYVCERADSSHCLHELVGRQLAAISTDAGGTLYRYPNLIRDCLRSILNREMPGRANAVKALAAAWYAEQGNDTVALNYALEFRRA